MRRVRGVELQPELADPELGGEPRCRQERGQARRQRLILGRGDRKQLLVTPERRRSGRYRRVRDLSPLLLTVVNRIEGTETGPADTHGVKRMLGLTDSTLQS